MQGSSFIEIGVSMEEFRIFGNPLLQWDPNYKFKTKCIDLDYEFDK